MLQVDCICTLARRSARSLTEIYDKAIASSGLKVTQYSLLRAIERLDSPSLTELSSATGLDRSTLGRNLRLLEKSGFVAVVHGCDERTRITQLTKEAQQALDIAKPLWAAVQRRITEALPNTTKQQLQNLNTVLESIQ